jgi:hypothetical protein
MLTHALHEVKFRRTGCGAGHACTLCSAMHKTLQAAQPVRQRHSLPLANTITPPSAMLAPETKDSKCRSVTLLRGSSGSRVQYSSRSYARSSSVRPPSPASTTTSQWGRTTGQEGACLCGSIASISPAITATPLTHLVAEAIPICV